MPSKNFWGRTAFILGGVLFGLVIYTFYYAEGASYLSDKPESCKNCHIMNAQYDSWLKSSHGKFASCNDCHLPTSFFSKYLAKAANGWSHSVAFTLQNFHEPIRIKPANKVHLQQNCVRCHRPMVENILQVNDDGHYNSNCVQCHNSAGHGEYTGLGGD